MATPFIDTLSSAQLQFVSRKSLGEDRPSYYSAAAAAGMSGDRAGYLQISLDLEAVLILLPLSTKRGLLSFIESAADALNSTDANDYLLFSEIVNVRTEGYGQVVTDVGEPARAYASTRGEVLGLIEQQAQRQLGTVSSELPVSAAQATAVVIPDLSTLFSALTASYDSTVRPEELAMHDRLTDAGFLYSIQNAPTDRSTELLSWVSVIRTYAVS